MKNILFLLVILIFGFSSCEDLLTKEIEYEEIGFEPLMVVNGLINPKEVTVSDHHVIGVGISENHSISEVNNSGYLPLDGAEVELKIGEDIYYPDDAYAEGNLNYVILIPESVDLIGKELSVSANHVDFPDVTATTNIPVYPNINNIEFTPNVAPNPEGGEHEWARIRMEIDDDGSTDDYYRVSIAGESFVDTLIFGMDTIFQEYGGIIYLLPENAGLATISQPYIYFSDDNFNGTNYPYGFIADLGNFQEDKELTLVIESLSEEAYFFQTSYDRYIESSDFGFFSEPVTVYSNVEGGLGIFGGSSKFEFPLE